MKTIILAAGYATRLYPLTENFPKPLLEIGGRPILDWLIEDVSSETDEFVVVTNHKYYGHFETWARNHSENIRLIDDGTETNENRCGAVRDMQLAITGKSDCLVMAGDNVLDFSLKPFITFGRNCGTSCVMCYEENELSALRRTAVITIDNNGLITSYEEKPKSPKGNLAVPPFYYYRAGEALRINEALLDGCKPDAPGSFAAWLSHKVSMHAWRMTGRRYDIGDMNSYKAIRGSYSGIE